MCGNACEGEVKEEDWGNWEEGVGKLGNSGEAKALQSLPIVTNCNACYVFFSCLIYALHYTFRCLFSSLSNKINRRKLPQ